MKISEVVKKLQEIQKEHGDLYVWIDGNEIDDNNFKVIWNSINIEKSE